VVADTVHGPMICFARDTGVSTTLRRFGEYAAGELHLYRKLLAPGDTVVDVGTNIGAISVAVQRARQGYRIWGFEPQPASYAVARANLLGGDHAQVLPYPSGTGTG
jgi:ubiquinone/menaquinone biosynthesis C-methylase UbiE